MKTKFDLEDSILKCWEVVEDLELISEQKELTLEEYRELLESLRVLYNLKFTELFSIFEDYIDSGDV